MFLVVSVLWTDDELDFPFCLTQNKIFLHVILRQLLFYVMLQPIALFSCGDILNQLNQEVIQRQGALLLVENGKLLHVELPKEGVNVQGFFGDK